MSRCFKNNNFEPIKSSKEYTQKKIADNFFAIIQVKIGIKMGL